MRLLVTGGTGLLGNNVIRAAIDRGYEVATLCRTGSGNPAFLGIPVEVFSADVSNPDTLEHVFKSRFDAVVHSAAHIQIGWSALQESMKINRDGTRNLLAYAKRQNSKFVHVSTVNTLPVGSQTEPADETTVGDGQIPCTYVLSKRAAEAEVRKAIDDGLHANIVHPGFMLGPWDWKPSSGRMIQALQGFALLAPPGGCSVCDPRDVAQAILNTIDRAPSGRNYILGGENLTYLELWRQISCLLGKRGPFTYMRKPGIEIASRLGDMTGWLLGREQPINSAAVRITTQFHWYSSQRAKDEIGYQFRPAIESIHDAINWLRNHEMLRAQIQLPKPYYLPPQSEWSSLESKRVGSS